MKKSILTLFLTAAVVTTSIPFTALAAQKATPTASTVYVNGKNTAFDAYNIDGSNYFKLRDLAFALNGTEKQFEVAWDNSKNAINMLSATAYTVAGGELAKGDGQVKTASETTSKIYINGNEVKLSAYNIGGSNYFKLRDMMSAFNVYVGWDGSKNAITLETAKGYGEESTEIVVEEPITSEDEIAVPVVYANSTGVDIYELYVSPANQNDWGEDILAEDILANGEMGVGYMVFDANTLVWDIRMVDGQGNAVEFYSFDFSEGSTEGNAILLTYDSQTGTGTAELYAL